MNRELKKKKRSHFYFFISTASFTKLFKRDERAIGKLLKRLSCIYLKCGLEEIFLLN